MGDDWTEKEPADDSYEEVCPKCGVTNLVTVRVGPMHGGWAEDYTPDCAKRGSLLNSGKAFALISVKLRKGR
jgi:hypothetical protein